MTVELTNELGGVSCAWMDNEGKPYQVVFNAAALVKEEDDDEDWEEDDEEFVAGLGIFDGIKGGLGNLLGDAGWLKFLLAHRADFTRLLAIFNSFGSLDWATDAGFSKALDLSLEAAAILTKFSGTPKDDAFVKTIESLLADPELRKTLAELLRVVVAKDGTVRASESGAATADEIEASFAIEALGFDWASLMKLLPIVVEIIKRFWPKPKEPTPAGVDAEGIFGGGGANKERRLKAMKAQLARLENLVVELKKKIAELESQPAPTA